jgi:hypothetical protein
MYRMERNSFWRSINGTGNMVKDLNKGISLIEYNCLNL